MESTKADQYELFQQRYMYQGYEFIFSDVKKQKLAEECLGFFKFGLDNE